MEATDSEHIRNEDSISDVTDAEKKELQKLLASVIYKRKTIPLKCMKIDGDIIHCEIEQLKNIEVNLGDDQNSHKFWKLVQKLNMAKPPKICFDDLKDAERRLVKCKQRLKDINRVLKKTRHIQ